MGFLSEALNSVDDTATTSPFTESIILATICGRVLSHRQQSAVDCIYNGMPQLFWERHEWLYMMLKTRSDSLTRNYPSATHKPDSLLLFTNMMAQTTVLYLCKVIESMTWETDDYHGTILDFKQRALMAAQEIVKLARSLPQLSYFKVNYILHQHLVWDQISNSGHKNRFILSHRSPSSSVSTSSIATGTSMTQ
jgi:hypothetical protein